MANKSTSDSTHAGALQRGKACLRCRKRKMKCDGSKPACQQCMRAKKADCCEYDDGKGKTRTQLLRETITRLEQRVRELEDPEFTTPSITLYDPHLHQRSDSSSSSMSSPSSAIFSPSHSPFPAESAASPNGSWMQRPDSISPAPTCDGTDPYFFDEPPTLADPPFELSQMLLDIFLPHRHQCGFEAHIGRLRDSVSRPLAEQRHPVLMNAIFLWACYISRPGPLCQHEPHFLARSLEALDNALQHPHMVLDVIQASCLLSSYFLSNGRLLEGGYHASAAASLAVQCGLHEELSREGLGWASDSMEPFALKPPMDSIEEGERIMAFWQVYNLDRCWSVILRKPAMIPDGRNMFHSINVPWPQSVPEYELGHVDRASNFQTVQRFFDGPNGPLSGGFSTLALRAKASALFERADQLSGMWDPRMGPSTIFMDEAHSLEQTITRFLTTLIPIHQLNATLPDDKHPLIVAHTLASAAMIQLYSRYSHEDPVAYDKCLRSARSCVTIIKHTTDSDFNFLEPIIGPCWTLAAEILVQELTRIETSWPLANSADLRSEIGTLLYAMTSLNARFPLLGPSVAKIQGRLAEL